MNKGLLVLVLLLLFSCQKENKVPDSTSQSLTARLDSLYEADVYRGFSVAVVNEDGLLYNRGFGFADVAAGRPYTEETIINIASVSKVFVGVALLKAQELNLLDLDDPIGDYLPFTVANPKHPEVPITLRHLATHTSSIVDGDTYLETDYINKDDVPIGPALQERYKSYYQNPSSAWMPLADYLRKLLQAGEVWYADSMYADRAPGALFEYSNIGTALCALVIELAAEMPFHAFTTQHIFEPLGMSATGWRFEDVDMASYSKLYLDDKELPYYTILSYPDGALISSSTDLGLFLSELIQGYNGRGLLLSSEGYEALFASQLSDTQLDGREGFNAGLFIEKHLAYNDIGHSGGDPGVNTLMFFDSETLTGRVMILNSDSDKENSYDIYWGIWNALDDHAVSFDTAD
ncbi:MAG: serine hydrolase domain-containing protein [Bacteroidota bacterium]